MRETETKSQIFLAQLVVLLAIAFVVVGAISFGFSTKACQRMWQDLLDRQRGPMAFRLILQPVMAAIAALHDGMKDAKLSRSPYLWTLIVSQTERASRLREGLISTARIILLALGMDTIYQLFVLKTFYPGEALIVSILLAFVPYLLLRGPTARIARWWRGDPIASASRQRETGRS
jgi:hypothetical protein